MAKTKEYYSKWGFTPTPKDEWYGENPINNDDPRPTVFVTKLKDRSFDRCLPFVRDLEAQFNVELYEPVECHLVLCGKHATMDQLIDMLVDAGMKNLSEEEDNDETN